MQQVEAMYQKGTQSKDPAGRRASQTLAAACCLLLSGAALPLCAQELQAPAPVPAADPFLITSHADPSSIGDLYAEIDDAANGDRWLLVRNKENPAGPGRLLRIPKGEQLAEVPGLGHFVVESSRPIQMVKAPPTVIRNGERITVEEHTQVADLQMEAMAMGPAPVGAIFYARLTIGGTVLRVEALGPGRARMANEGEASR